MIKRLILDKIKHWLGSGHILILKGARQVGKTTLLQEIRKHVEIEKEGKVVYFSADETDIKSIFVSASSFLEHLRVNYSFPKEFLFVIIDEFQTIPNAGLILKNIFDRSKDNLQLIVSGSSSLEIMKNSEYLTGRAIHFDVGRISFQEYFDYREGFRPQSFLLADFRQWKMFYETLKPKLELYFTEYLAYGGYPKVLISPMSADKEIVLRSVLKTYIEKDIINQLNIENVTGFNNLIKVLAAQVGQLMNVNDLANTVDISIPTIKKYLEILQGTYIISLVTPYFTNIRSEISKMPKVFLSDNGIRNYVLRSFQSIVEGNGAVVENFVYTTLREQFDEHYIHFYRTTNGVEVDFVLDDKDNKLMLCEVKYRNKVTVPLAMKNFKKRYPGEVSRKIIITKDDLRREKDTYFIPAVLLPFIQF